MYVFINTVFNYSLQLSSSTHFFYFNSTCDYKQILFLFVFMSIKLKDF